jgi:paraquat-inducible protein A
MSGSFVACHECDAVYRPVPLQAGQKARCRRCGAVLYRKSRLRPVDMLAVVLAALVTYLIANACPIVDLNVQGAHNTATLLASVVALWSEGRILVALLVGVTALVVPLVDLGLMLVVLTAAVSGRPTHRSARLLRLVQSLRPWGMIEIFMLGILVSLVKLSHLAQVVPGVALWAFCALTVLFAVVISWDLKSLWDGSDEEPAP